MAYNIQSIQDFTVMDRDMYFLDSNAWIWYINAQQFGDENLKDRQKHYADFISNIILLNLDTSLRTPKQIKRPKIVITSLLLSELTNAYMRGAMNAYLEEYSYTEEEKKRYNFKKFRKTLEFKDQYRNLLSIFQSMHSFLHFIDDEFLPQEPVIGINTQLEKEYLRLTS